MNILVLIKELDKSPLEREVRNGYVHGDVITFYNETDFECNLIIDNVEYSNIIQVCIILKDETFYIYIQHGENPNFIKLDVDNIGEINCIFSI